MPPHGTPRHGTRTFLAIWAAEMTSLVGTAMTSFAIGVSVYLETGSIMQFALIAFFTMLPGVLMAPLAGALVDRWDRREAMLFGDAGAAIATIAVADLVLAGRLETWHVYIAAGVASAFGAFQVPAYTAAVASLVPQRHLTRANALVGSGQAIASLVAPPLAALLVGAVGLRGVLLIDIATFAIAIVTLLRVRVPLPPEGGEGAPERGGSLLREAAFGLRYIAARPGLLGIQLLYAAGNFIIGLWEVLITPAVLAFASPLGLGAVWSAGGAAILLGSLLLLAWGGPARRIPYVLGATAAMGLGIATMGVAPLLGVVALGNFCFLFAAQVSNSCATAIWQTKVAPQVQGRVFATQQMIDYALLPLGYLAAAPLAEGIFEPLLAPGGALAGSVGALIGVGPGRGIGLLLVVAGTLFALAAAAGFRSPRIRLLEQELPDYQPDPA